MMKRTLLLVLTAAFLITGSTVSFAQDDVEVAAVVKITPVRGHEDTLITAITDYHKWVAQFEGHHRYTWYEVLTGPDTGKYIARTGEHGWADFDAEYDWQEKANEVFMTNIRPHVESAERMMTTSMNEFSHWPEDMTGYTHFSVTQWTVRNGHMGKFRKMLSKITNTLKAGGFQNYWAFYSVASGGYGSQIGIVSPNKGWTDMGSSDGPSFVEIMTKELGGEAEFEAFMQDWGTTFKSGQNMMLKRMDGASDYGN